MGTIYESIDDFDTKTAKGIESMLYSSESFIGAIPCWDFMFSKRSATKLVLTDHRIIAFKRGFIRQKEKDALLEKVTSIGFKKGFLFGKIYLKGPGFSYKNLVSRSNGRKFASEIRQQTH